MANLYDPIKAGAPMGASPLSLASPGKSGKPGKASKPKKKQCQKGYSCGVSCISKGFNCLNPLRGQGKNYAAYLQKHAAKAARDARKASKAASPAVPPAPKVAPAPASSPPTPKAAPAAKRGARAIPPAAPAPAPTPTPAPAPAAPPAPKPTMLELFANVYEVSVKDSKGVEQKLSLDSGRFGDQPYADLTHTSVDGESRRMLQGLAPNINRLVGIQDLKEEMFKPERMNTVLSSVCKDGDIVFIPAFIRSLSDGRGNVRKDLDLSSFTPVGNATSNQILGGAYIGKMEGGRVVPLSADDKKRAALGAPARLARRDQVAAIDEEFNPALKRANIADVYRREDAAAAKADPLEDQWLGRKPKPGAVPDLAHWENRASQWAKQQGFSDDGVNGFTAAQTKAHDVAHPITHEMTGLNSQQIWQRFGSVKGADGKPSLLAEEAIVNVVEHLSRGDSLEASIVNGLRLTRVLSRGSDSTSAGRALVRSKEFKDTLTELAEQVYRNDNFNDYMAHVRTTNRISKTVAQRGDDFTNTASGG